MSNRQIMTSWLDTKKYMTSLAKSAIADAKKSLDKALEIDEDEQKNGEKSSVISTSDSNSVTFDQWGSFTGSFFNLPGRESQDQQNVQPSLSHSQSEPVSLQPTKVSDLLLKTVIPEENDELPTNSDNVIECNASAIMQESDESPIMEEVSSNNEMIEDPEKVVQEQALEESKLESSMSSSRTTLVSAFESSSSGTKLDSTLTEEDQGKDQRPLKVVD